MLHINLLKLAFFKKELCCNPGKHRCHITLLPLPIVAATLQRPLSSVPLLAIVKRLECVFIFPRKLDSLLKPDKKRADELKEEFAKGFNGIVKRIWPHVNLALACSTGILNLLIP